MLIQSIYQFINSLKKRRKFQLVALLGLMLLSALAEMISLSAIIPFIGVLTNPTKVLQNDIVNNLIVFLNLELISSNPKYWFTVIFISVVFTAGVVRLLLVFAISRVNFGIGHDLGVEVYRRTLYQPYHIHISRNSSEIISAINKIDSVVLVLQSLLYLISASILSLFLIVALLVANFEVAIIALFVFIIFYLLISVISRPRLKIYGQNVRQAHDDRIKLLQEGLSGIRDILLDHTQEFFSRRFDRIDGSMRRSQSNINFISPAPRYIIEAVVVIMIALLTFNLAKEGEFIDIVATLGFLALGGQRLLPLLQQIYAGWVNVSANYPMFTDVVKLIQQPIEERAHKTTRHSLMFNSLIELNNISFSYNNSSPTVLNNISITIPKGSRVGFIGSTGSGKSTLIDLIMGLLSPTTGTICIDGIELDKKNQRAWQNNIAHVPQSIFLTDSTFIENIAFGVPRECINFDRVKQAAKQANIAETIDKLSDGYETMAGERGVRLSGGQQQRIGIARALYKVATVLVLDEATSALDSETESNIMNEISNLDDDLTVLIIAHRLSTLRNCDIIFELDEGGVIATGTFEELIGDIKKI